ncbi:MAG: glycosyltransferase family 2 protein [Acidobacteria bacterium]|nr:MAG: glycosyltransferase family 2 protein [Acidobacteriota bacterium]
MTPPALSIVIPTWNGRDLLARFLPSVAAELTPERELVISDDGSTDGTAAWLAEHYPAARVLRSERNRGFGPAANAGIETARAEIVVLLNSDVELTPGCLDPIALGFDRSELFGITLRAFDLPEKVFSTGGKLGRFRRGFWESWRNYEQPAGASFMLAGGFCAFRRSAFLELGGFDPVFAPYYSEDLDLSYRARKRGWQLAYEPASVLYHQRSSSVNRHQNRFRRQAIIERNRLLFHWRNLDRSRLLRHLAWAHLLLLQMLLKGNWAYHLGYGQALRRIGQVRRFRASEKPYWRLRDAALELAATSQAVSASSVQGFL